MRTTIRNKNLEMTPAFSEYIETKLVSHVERMIKGRHSKSLPILDLEFGRSTKHHQKGKVFYASASLTIGAKVIRGKVEAENVRMACDMLRRELEQDIVRDKGRTVAVGRRIARRLKELRFNPAARRDRKGRTLDEGS